MAAEETALVAELAELANVSLAPEDAQTLGAQLDTILAYIRRLQGVDVDGVPEYASADQVRSGLRDDVAVSRVAAERIRAGAQTDADGHVDVPKFKD